MVESLGAQISPECDLIQNPLLPVCCVFVPVRVAQLQVEVVVKCGRKL